MKSTINIGQRIIAFILTFCLCVTYFPSLNIQRAYAMDSENDGKKYEVTLADCENGALSFAERTEKSTEFKSGDIVTINIKSDENYVPYTCVVKSSISGTEIFTFDVENSESVSFEMPDVDIDVSVNFMDLTTEDEIMSQTSKVYYVGTSDDIEAGKINDIEGQIEEDTEKAINAAKKADNKELHPITSTIAEIADSILSEVRAATGTMKKTTLYHLKNKNGDAYRYNSPTWKCTGTHDGSHYFYSSAISLHTIDGEYAYCVQPNASSDTSGSYSTTSGDWGEHLGKEIRDTIKLILAHAQPNINRTGSDKAEYAAAQVLIWEVIIGTREPYTLNVADGFTSSDKALDAAVRYGISGENANGISNRETYVNARAEIIADVRAANNWSEKTPSYKGKTITITNTDGTLSCSGGSITKSGSNYIITISDSNAATSDFNFSSVHSGMKIDNSDDGKLKITLTEAALNYLTTKRTIKGSAKYVTPSNVSANVWYKADRQTLLTNGTVSRLSANVSLLYETETSNPPEYGKLGLIKVDSETGAGVDGAVYWVYTDKECQNRASIFGSESAENTDGEFAVLTTAPAGNAVGDGHGRAYWVKLEVDNTTHQQTYYFKEVARPDGYLLDPTVHEVVVKEVSVSKKETGFEPTWVGATYNPNYPDEPHFVNDDALKDSPSTWFNIIKKDSKTGEYLEGAVYGLFTDSACTKPATTADGDEAIIESRLPEGTSGITAKDGIEVAPGTYFVKELTPPKGYLLNTTVDKVTLNYTSNKEVVKTYTDDRSEGYVSINKYSSTNTSQRLSGAQFTFYTDRDCTQVAKDVDGNDAIITTTTTGSNKLTFALDSEETNDNSSIDGEPGGSDFGDGTRTLYYKETKTPDDSTGYGYTLDPTVYSVELTAGDTIVIDRQNVPNGNAFLNKVSADKTMTDGDTSYSLEGAVYEVYSDGACTKSVGTLTTDKTGKTNTLTLPAGTYYVKEKTASKGYELCKDVHTVTVTAGKTSSFTCEEVPNGKAYLTKTSANPSLTDDNSCYSLEGAVYEVYSDKACTTSVGTLTTDQTGKTNALTLPAGTYYVKEKTASKGYMLCEDVHTVTVTAGKISSFTCEETPLDDPFQLTLHKLSADSSGNTQGAASLEGAIFEVAYWDNTNGNTSGSPTRKWYYKTIENANGESGLRVNNEQFYVANVTLEDGTVLSSDPLYKDEFGDIISPLGTFVVKEVIPPKYYQNEGTMRFTNSSIGISSDVKTGLKFIVALDSNGLPCIYCNSVASGNVISAQNLSINVFDESYKGSIKVIKYNESGSVPLEGVSFKLVGDDGSTHEATTNSNGEIVFENLIPQHYVLTETKTLDGLSLLKDNVDIDLPMEMTEQEVADQHADKNQAVWDNSSQAYCFYNLTYEITNEPQFVMPMTGGTQWPLYAGLGAAVAMIGGCTYVILRRKKLS